MHAHTPTHNLWLCPKRPPLAFSVAVTSVAEMFGPKCPRPKCPTFDQTASEEAFWSGSSLFAILTSFLWISALIAHIF